MTAEIEGADGPTDGAMVEKFKSMLVRHLPSGVLRWLIALRHGRLPGPAVGGVKFGDLRRLTPISRGFGWDRGTPVDRYYIEAFLKAHSAAIRGHVLEVSEDTYTRKFGGDSVERIDVLHVSDPAPPVTIIADLTDAPDIPSDTFDCVIVTQTMVLIYDFAKAIETLHRILKPGGTVLMTTPGMSPIADPEWKDGWYWGMTEFSAGRMFSDRFGAAQVTARSFGNVLASVAFLHGLSQTELTTDELDFMDPEYQLLIGVAATKAGGAAG